MLDKVDISRIVLDHVRTLKDYSSGRYRPTDFLLFFGVPAVVASVIEYFYGTLEANLIAIVATSLSIFAALLFNLLLLVYDVTGRSAGSIVGTNRLRQDVLREVFSNISFAILVAMVAIVSVLILLLVDGFPPAERALSAITYYLVTLFLLTLLMLLKRVHILLQHETKA